MARDTRLARRNALAIPGWLLIVYSLAGIIYGEVLRTKSDYCPESNLILIDGLCYTVWKLLLPVLLVGIGLAIGGAVGFPGKPDKLQQRLEHGTPTHVMLAVLASFIIVPLALIAIQAFRQVKNDRVYILELGGVPFKHIFVLQVTALIAALVFIPYLVSVLADVRRRRTMIQAAVTPPTETSKLPHEAGFVHAEEDWPASREPDASDASPDVEEAASTPEDAKTTDAPTIVTSYAVPEIPVIDIEGIGPQYAANLEEAGVTTTARLAVENPHALAAITGIGVARIMAWQKMSELLAVKGIGPQYAEALVSAGIEGVDELRRRTAGAISKQVNTYVAGLEKNIIGTKITEARVAAWKEAAKGMRKRKRELPS